MTEQVEVCPSCGSDQVNRVGDEWCCLICGETWDDSWEEEEEEMDGGLAEDLFES